MTLAEVNEQLNSFDPIGLSEMDQVELMNRIDRKYVLSAKKIPELLRRAEGAYKILEINSIRSFPYSTTYLDTSDYLFFNQHLRGQLDRNKVRYRKYVSTDTSFLEVKRTTNKNRTIKWRIKNSLSSENAFDLQADEFLTRYVPMQSISLKPVLFNKFTRITLVGLEMNERVTIDTNLSFADISGKTHDIQHIAIVEIKSASGSGHSPVARILKDFSVRPTGFSKYCIGTSLLYDIPKKNNIKSKLLLLNKLDNELN